MTIEIDRAGTLESGIEVGGQHLVVRIWIADFAIAISNQGTGAAHSVIAILDKGCRAGEAGYRDISPRVIRLPEGGHASPRCGIAVLACSNARDESKFTVSAPSFAPRIANQSSSNEAVMRRSYADQRPGSKTTIRRQPQHHGPKMWWGWAKMSQNFAC